MLRSKRILIILFAGSFLIGLEIAGFSALNRAISQVANSLGRALGIIENNVEAATFLARQTGGSARPREFRWNWKDSQELDAQESLHYTKMSGNDRKALALAIEGQIDLNMDDLEIESKAQVSDAVQETRIKLIDLNGDGIAEVIGQGMVGCGATGNCPFWIFKKTQHGYRLVAESYGQTFTIQKIMTNGFHDIVVSGQDSATESELTVFRYWGGVYHDVGCYRASWTAPGDRETVLKNPRITPCDKY